MHIVEIAHSAMRRIGHHMAQQPDGLTAELSVPLDDRLQVQTEGLPSWWLSNGNWLLTLPDMKLPRLTMHEGMPLPTRAVVVVASDTRLEQVMVWGSDSLVVLGRGTSLPDGSIFCGPGATVVLGDDVTCTDRPSINARNGGLVHVGSDGLWASRIQIMTDDMHAIRDIRTGKRLNPFGGSVLIGRHVWIGVDAILLPGTCIGNDAVVGARAVVTGALPANAVSVGAPARPVRHGVTWTHADLP